MCIRDSVKKDYSRPVWGRRFAGLIAQTSQGQHIADVSHGWLTNETVPDFHRFLLTASRRRFEKGCYRLNQFDFRPNLFACDKVGPASIFRCQALGLVGWTNRGEDF